MHFSFVELTPWTTKPHGSPVDILVGISRRVQSHAGSRSSAHGRRCETIAPPTLILLLLQPAKSFLSPTETSFRLSWTAAATDSAASLDQPGHAANMIYRPRASRWLGGRSNHGAVRPSVGLRWTDRWMGSVWLDDIHHAAARPMPSVWHPCDSCFIHFDSNMSSLDVTMLVCRRQTTLIHRTSLVTSCDFLQQPIRLIQRMKQKSNHIHWSNKFPADPVLKTDHSFRDSWRQAFQLQLVLLRDLTLEGATPKFLGGLHLQTSSCIPQYWDREQTEIIVWRVQNSIPSGRLFCTSVQWWRQGSPRQGVIVPRQGGWGKRR